MIEWFKFAVLLTFKLAVFILICPHFIAIILCEFLHHLDHVLDVKDFGDLIVDTVLETNDESENTKLKE